MWLFVLVPGFGWGSSWLGAAVRQAKGLAWSGVGAFIYLGKGKKGEKATWECRKIFLFFLFFCLENAPGVGNA